MSGSKPLVNLDQKIANMETAAEEVRAATREAHEALKELKRVRKEIRELLDDEVPRIVAKEVGQQISDGLAGYGAVIQEAQSRAVEHIGREFNKLADLYLHGEDKRADHIAVLSHELRAERRTALGLRLEDWT